jgi:hypothetical protein
MTGGFLFFGVGSDTPEARWSRAATTEYGAGAVVRSPLGRI